MEWLKTFQQITGNFCIRFTSHLLEPLEAKAQVTREETASGHGAEGRDQAERGSHGRGEGWALERRSALERRLRELWGLLSTKDEMNDEGVWFQKQSLPFPSLVWSQLKDCAGVCNQERTGYHDYERIENICSNIWYLIPVLDTVFLTSLEFLGWQQCFLF